MNSELVYTGVNGFVRDLSFTYTVRDLPIYVMDTGSHWWGMSHGGVGVTQGNEVGVSAQEQDVVYYNGESEGQREEVRRCRCYEGMKDKELKA